jgi:hypothetical protein
MTLHGFASQKTVNLEGPLNKCSMKMVTVVLIQHQAYKVFDCTDTEIVGLSLVRDVNVCPYLSVLVGACFVMTQFLRKDS